MRHSKLIRWPAAAAFTAAACLWSRATRRSKLAGVHRHQRRRERRSHIRLGSPTGWPSAPMRARLSVENNERPHQFECLASLLGKFGSPTRAASSLRDYLSLASFLRIILFTAVIFISLLSLSFSTCEQEPTNPIAAVVAAQSAIQAPHSSNNIAIFAPGAGSAASSFFLSSH